MGNHPEELNNQPSDIEFCSSTTCYLDFQEEEIPRSRLGERDLVANGPACNLPGLFVITVRISARTRITIGQEGGAD